MEILKCSKIEKVLQTLLRYEDNFLEFQNIIESGSIFKVFHFFDSTYTKALKWRFFFKYIFLNSNPADYLSEKQLDIRLLCFSRMITSEIFAWEGVYENKLKSLQNLQRMLIKNNERKYIYIT